MGFRAPAERHALGGIRALSFDLDDTLWDCLPAIRHAEETLHGWFERETPRVTERHDRDALAARRAEIVAEHPELSGDVTALRRTVIARLLAEHEYPHTLVDVAFETFHGARCAVELYDGVPTMLERLGRRYRLAAITNGNADLARIGLAHHFDVIVAASLDLAAKPAPDMFRHCAERLGLRLHEMLHIGDNVATDVGGAQAAGARALWFNRRGDAWPAGMPTPEFEVASIAALVEMLDVEVPRGELSEILRESR